MNDTMKEQKVTEQSEKKQNGEGKTVKKRKYFEHWRIIAVFLVVYDIIAIYASYLAALWIRFDCQYSMIQNEYLHACLKFMPLYVVVSLIVFWKMKLYNSIWRFASYNELIRVTAATLITIGFHIAAITLIYGRMPVSYYAVGSILQFLLILCVRFSYRLILLERGRRCVDTCNGQTDRIMLIGGGAAGQMILREMSRASETSGQVVCIIDDNPNKWQRYIEDVPVVGGREDILLNVKKYKISQIYLAIPSASAEEKRDILNICKETGCNLKILPGMYQLVNGEVSVSHMREVAVEDLLGREPIKVNLEEIFEYLRAKTILVTGGGGSIGSELCRQIAAHSPKQLIIFDVYENNAYDIEQELRAKYPNLNLVVLIGSVRDSRRINSVFETYHPDVVYHAAAHKHVPLMETSPCEAIKNNVIGTYKTAYAALHNNCQRFVLISTDKAVNPTNIMGASKRLCEMVIQTMDKIGKAKKESILPVVHAHAAFDEDSSMQRKKPNGKTEFVAVRFGNVLGSNGSVIPLFKKQIIKGGPVTVTHPDIIRYFMTIPEAVSLVLQAGTYAKGGEVFVLDMGEPVKIDTLARNLIKLSGYRPDVDIPIVYTGLRPGEKLFEEKLMAEEGLVTTANKLIHIGKPIPFDEETFLVQLEKLAEASYNNCEDICRLVEEIVPTFHPEKAGKKESAYEKQREQMERVKQVAATAE